MRIWRTVAELLLALIALSAVAQKAEFNWNWRDQEVIGHHDASLGNTSKLTEPERAALLDAIVLRLQKPMTDAGYDDDRIREIASTTRVRFVDFGGGKPLLFATSLGLEGGCDPLGNCPLWIFRRSSGGFVSLLDAVAASYTLQSSDGELVLMHHVSQKQSGLEVYRLDEGKLNQGGCYTANWPAHSDDPTQVSDPEIVPCKEGTAAPLTPEAKPEMPPSPDGKAPLPDAPQPQVGDAKPETPEQKPEPTQTIPAETQAKPDAPEAKPDAPPTKPPSDVPAQSDTKPAPDAPPSDSKPVTPDSPQAGEAKPGTPDQTQQPAPDAPAEPQPKADTPEAKPDTPPADSKPPGTDAPPQPDTKPSSPDVPPPPDSKQAPDAPPPVEAKPDSPAPNQASPDSKPEAPQSPPDHPQAPPQSE
jgi:hypothetical protein